MGMGGGGQEWVGQCGGGGAKRQQAPGGRGVKLNLDNETSRQRIVLWQCIPQQKEGLQR